MKELQNTHLNFDERDQWHNNDYQAGRALILTIEDDLPRLSKGDSDMLRLIYFASLRGRGWFTRPELATWLKKPRLYPYHVDRLEKFVVNNWLDKETRARPVGDKGKGTGYDFWYRLKPSVLWCMQHIAHKRKQSA